MLRKYVRFSSYYFTVAVGLGDTLVMLLLAKHLWKAWWMPPITSGPHSVSRLPLLPADDGPPVDMRPEPVVTEPPGGPLDQEAVSIEIGVGEDLQCMDDNFVIEVILAALDFFRVSETKQD